MADHVDTRYTKFFQTPKSVSETDEDHLQSHTDHKHLISTLPRKTTDAKMPEEAAIYSFHGFSFPQHILLAILSSQKHFKPLPDDIFLTTYPKSGTTWIKALAFAILNRRSFPSNDTNHPLLTTNPQELIPHFEDLFMRGPLVPDLTVMARPRVFSSHIPYSLLPDSISRVVFVSRDPKDVLVFFVNFFNKSHSNFMPELTIEKAFEGMVGAESAYDPIWEHQMEYKRESLRRPDKVLFLKYEEMLENPLENVRNLAGFLSQPFTAEEGGALEEIVKLCSFDFLKEGQ